MGERCGPSFVFHKGASWCCSFARTSSSAVVATGACVTGTRLALIGDRLLVCYRSVAKVLVGTLGGIAYCFQTFGVIASVIRSVNQSLAGSFGTAPFAFGSRLLLGDCSERSYVLSPFHIIDLSLLRKIYLLPFTSVVTITSTLLAFINMSACWSGYELFVNTPWILVMRSIPIIIIASVAVVKTIFRAHPSWSYFNWHLLL